MGRNGLIAALALSLAIAACGGDAGDAQEGPDIAALRARNDSIRKARVAATVAVPDSAAADTAVDTLGAAPHETAVLRETFVYGGGARDPFASLLTLKSTGPELVDLQLVGVYENLEEPSQSVAVVRDKNADKRYKLRPGEQIGRLRVAAIRGKDVVFAISDFGYERQETLSLRKPQEDDTP